LLQSQFYNTRYQVGQPLTKFPSSHQLGAFYASIMRFLKHATYACNWGFASLMLFVVHEWTLCIWYLRFATTHLSSFVFLLIDIAKLTAWMKGMSSFWYALIFTSRYFVKHHKINGLSCFYHAPNSYFHNMTFFSNRFDNIIWNSSYTYQYWWQEKEFLVISKAFAMQTRAKTFTLKFLEVLSKFYATHLGHICDS